MKLKEIKRPLGKSTIGVLIGIIFAFCVHNMDLVGGIPLVLFMLVAIIMYIINKNVSIGFVLGTTGTIFVLNDTVPLSISIFTLFLILEPVTESLREIRMKKSFERK